LQEKEEGREIAPVRVQVYLFVNISNTVDDNRLMAMLAKIIAKNKTISA
jgi:hypothetical protein